ncbi:alpha/beta hydrolase-fold protein [Marinoscillum sp.]|uniref:carboxylesterase family protein n=1 Tax=Marinoscillum sp. TaxID=2024838 RepID=UPI003BADB901
MRILVFTLLSLLLWSCSSPGPGRQVWVDDGLVNELDGYWLYLPESFSKEERWPVLVYLVGGDMASGPNPRSAKNEGPIRYAVGSKDEQLSNLVLDNFIIINPHMTTGPRSERQWGQHADAIVHLVDQVISQYNGDSQKVTITGPSKGGRGCWSVIKKHPDRFNKVIAISGQVYCESGCEQLIDKPIWIIHNDEDDLVSSQYSKDVVSWFQNHQIDFLKVDNMSLSTDELSNQKLFTLCSKKGHDAWSAAYSSPEFYEWILNH